MSQLAPSFRLYLFLILLLAALGALNAFLPQGEITALATDHQLSASRGVLGMVNGPTLVIVYGGLGLLGRKLALSLGWPDLLADAVSARQRWVIPALAGVGLVTFSIVADSVMSGWHGLGPLMQPPFPTSIVASVVAAIGEELIFRLALVSFWCWLVGQVILKGDASEPVFWAVAVFSAIAFAAGHVPGLMFAYGLESLGEVPIALLAEIALLNGVLSLVAAWYLRLYGFVAAIGVHLWTDLVCHVIWGLLV